MVMAELLPVFSQIRKPGYEIRVMHDITHTCIG